MRAIVTGATGFIGSWLTLHLLSNFDEVTVIVRNRKRLLKDIKKNPRITVIEKDISEVVTEDFKTEWKYDVCYNLAWSGVAPEHKNSLVIQLRNIEVSTHLLEVCASIGCKKFISAGTVAEYAFCDNVIDVNNRQTPNDIYGATKTSAHYILEVRARQLNISFNWIVISSTFGERREDNNIVTYTIKSLLKGERPQYGDLKQMWDFLYVGEAVRAIRLLGEYSKPNKVYGIGSGEYRPLREYITIIRDIINPNLELGIGDNPSMSKQTFSSCVNTYDLIYDTGFRSEVSFENGVKRTVQWFIEQM